MNADALPPRPQNLAPLPISGRIALVRQALGAHGLQALMVPSSDPHLSEYLPGHWQGREWFSGFTGSMGTLVVTASRAAVFTDSRYWEQAAAELAGTGVDLVRLEGAVAPACADWLQSGTDTPSGEGVLSVDGRVLGLAQAQQLTEALGAKGWTLRTDLDLLDGLWADRPALPEAPVFEHLPPFCHRPRSDKLSQLRQALQARGATHHLISTLDDLAWLLNLRGSDVDYNPMFLAHLLVAPEQATLFISEGKVDAALAERVAADGVRLAAYAEAERALSTLPEGAVLWIDPKRVTYGLRHAVPDSVRVIEAANPTVAEKACKSDADAECIREAMARDGAAMCGFYAWFEQALGRETITELTVDERLTAARLAQPDCVGLSFPTIAGFNANGALPHYRATPASHAVLSTPTGLAAHGLLLIDSGAQFLGGTTDITRVWPIGDPTPAQRADYTRVLRGTMNLSRARFPVGTLAPALDALARAPLWESGLDYGHGTGHGVGYFLGVHEGPQSISKTIAQPAMAMQPGMVTSIEPAVYRPGRWGVRIENLVLNVRSQAAAAEEFGEFLEFETLTLCPIDTRCIERSLLRPDEIDWLNRYHDTVRTRLAPRLQGSALDWLLARTAPL